MVERRHMIRVTLSTNIVPNEANEAMDILKSFGFPSMLHIDKSLRGKIEWNEFVITSTQYQITLHAKRFIKSYFALKKMIGNKENKE